MICAVIVPQTGKNAMETTNMIKHGLLDIIYIKFHPDGGNDSFVLIINL